MSFPFSTSAQLSLGSESSLRLLEFAHLGGDLALLGSVLRPQSCSTYPGDQSKKEFNCALIMWCPIQRVMYNSYNISSSMNVMLT